MYFKLSKILLTTFLILFLSFLTSILFLPSGTFAQSDSTDQVSEDFDKTVEEAREEYEKSVAEMDEEYEEKEQEMNETSEEFDSVVEDMNREYEEDVQKADEEYEANKEEMMENFDGYFGKIEKLIAGVLGITAVGGLFVLILSVLIIILSLAGLVFDIIMIIDCLNREFENRTLWLVILIGGGLIGLGLMVSIAYFFVVKKKLDSKK